MNEMNSIETAHTLSNLAQLDINAIYSYDRAIESTELLLIRDNLGDFREKHSEHALALARVILALGVKPPEYSPDFKGMLMEGFTAISGTIGVEGSIRAMLKNEQHLMNKYREAYALPLSGNIKQLVGHNYRDIQAMIDVLQQMLTNRVWEKAA